MQIKNILPKNNLKTLFIHNPSSTAATVQVWFRAGSALETDQNKGIAHFLEHMFFKGTPTRPGAMIAKEIESFGGEINAFTSFDYTCYYVNTPNPHIINTLNILLDMVSNPEFKQEELVPEREVVMEEFKRSKDNPQQVAFSELQSTCFLDGYAHQILGNQETISKFSREQLSEFREEHYNLANAMLVIAGDLNNEPEIIETIEKYSMPQGKPSSFPQFQLKSNATINIHQKEVRQALLTIVLPAPAYEGKLAPTEDLTINSLAHGETSRLYKRLVNDNSLASSVSGSTMFFADGGCHFIRVACPEENLTPVYKELLAILEDIFKNPAKNGFSKEEVDRIKNQYVASKVYEKESIESFAFSLGHGFAQNGDIHCEDKFIEKMKNISAKSINEQFISIFSMPAHVSLQTPTDQNTSTSKKLFADLSKFHKKLNGISTRVKRSAKKIGSLTSSKYDKQTKLIKLKNGAKLIYRQNKMTPTFVFHTYMKGGLTEENKNNNGQYNLLSSMLTKGHSKIPYETIKKELEDYSASIGGFTGKNAYGLTLHGQSEHTQELLTHFWGALLHPDIPNKRLNHEKKLVLRSIDNAKEDPVRICFKEFSNIIFQRHPYSFDILGTPTTVKKISATSLKELHQKNLKKKEILFTYCGDMELEELLILINPYLEQLTPRKTEKRPNKKIVQNRGKVISIDLPREQTHIMIGCPAYKLGAKKDIYLKMLTTYLSGQSSDLFVEIRDKQALCYSIQAVHFTALEAGYWGIYIGTANEKKQQAIDAITDLLNKIRENGIDKKDLNRVKTMIEGQVLINVQTNDDYASIYSVPELQSLGLDYFYKNTDSIKETSLDEFNQFLASFLKTKWNIVTVGKEIS